MGRCCECPHSRPNEKAGDCSHYASSHDAGEAVPMATGCRRGWDWGPFTSCQGKKELRDVRHLPVLGRGAGWAPRGRDEFKAAGKSWGAVVTALLHLDSIL